MATSYCHSFLPSDRCVRLLSICERSSSDPCRLACSLHVFDIDTCPPYPALSYTWGAPLRTAECEEAYSAARDETIYINRNHQTGVATIGRNLYEALLKLRRFRSDPPIIKPDSSLWSPSAYLWVDAICIDQSNNAEKTSQVAMMGEIYAKAQNVYAWLGSDSTEATYPDIARILGDFLDQWTEWKAKNPDHGPVVLYDWTDPQFDPLTCGSQLTIPRSVFKSLARFVFQRPYHSRLWIMQEIVLAKSGIMICDDWMLPCSRFSQFPEIYQTEILLMQSSLYGEMIQYTQPSELHATNTMPLSLMHDSLRSLRQSLASSELADSTNDNGVADYLAQLYVLFNEMRLAGRSNTRDRVFALLGVIESIGMPNTQAPLSPNYDMNVEGLDSEVTSSLFLSHLPRLAALSLVEHQLEDDLSKRPSWALRLRPRAKLSALIHLERRGCVDSTMKEPAINACGKYASSSTRPKYTRSELEVQGCKLGTVRSCSGAFGIERFWTGTLTDDRTGLSKFSTAVTVDSAAFILQSYSELGPCHWSGQSTDEIILQTTTHYGSAEPYIEEDLQNMRSGLLRFLLNMDWKDTYEDLDFDRDHILATLRSLSPCRGIPSLEELTHFKMAIEDGRKEQVYENIKNGVGWTVLMSELSDGRRMFRTDTEFGYEPSVMLPGDELWILIPARVPFILRPSNEVGRYYLIGDAYAHGVMFGEAMDRVNENAIHDVPLI